MPLTSGVYSTGVPFSSAGSYASSLPPSNPPAGYTYSAAQPPGVPATASHRDSLSAATLSASQLPPYSNSPAAAPAAAAPVPQRRESATAGTPARIFPASPMRTNESTISITNTAWERALDDLKKDLDTLKAEGGMGPLRKLLQMKVEELERVRQSEMVKEKELHRLQDLYAEEIRKHTEDLNKVRKAESDLSTLKQAEADRLRQAQEAQAAAAAAALARLEEAAALSAKKSPKKSKKSPKKSKKSPKRSPGGMSPSRSSPGRSPARSPGRY